MICTKCNANLPDGYRFCPKCGTVFAYPGETPEESLRLAKIQHEKYVQYMQAQRAKQAAPKAMDVTLPVEEETKPEVQSESIQEAVPVTQQAAPAAQSAAPAVQSAAPAAQSTMPAAQPAARAAQLVATPALAESAQPQQAVVIERQDYLQPRPSGYAAGNYAVPFPERHKTTSGLAVTALVLGAIALMTSFLPIINNFSFVLALIGAVFAVVGIVATGKSKAKKGRGLAIAGLLTSVIAAILVLVTQSMYVAAIQSAVEGPKPVTTSEASEQADYSSMAVGQSVSLDNGMVVTVTGVRSGLSDYSGDPITEVTVSYSNSGKSNEHFNALDWKAEDANGVLDGYTIIINGENELHSGQLSPGGSVTGNLYFKGDTKKVYYYSNVLVQSSSSICWVVG